MDRRCPPLDASLIVAGLAIFVAVGSLVGGEALILVWVSFAIAILWVAALRASLLRRAALGVAALILPFALLESALQIEHVYQADTTYRDDGTPGRFFEKPAPLGYWPLANQRYNARKFWADGRTVYDVDYTIGPDHFRETPGGDVAARGETALFFGGSFVFGEGLQDDETLPFYYSEALDHRVRARNFGVLGYGPHQMLRAIELGLVAPRIEGRVVAAYYLLITAHLERIVNETTWGHWDPRYRISADGEARFDGAFVEPSNWVAEAFVTSRLRRRIHPWFALPDEQKRDLMLAILATARRRLAEEFGVSLEVLIWDQGTRAEAIEKALEASDIPYLQAADWLGDHEQDRYEIPGDGHPSALANRQVGRGLAGLTREARWSE